MMLLKLLKAERMKLKRAPVWLAFLIIPIIPAVLGTCNYAYHQSMLKEEWYSLWTQHTIFTCYFFLPIMLGVYCAYIMRLEHANRNWNKLFTMPTSRSMIFLSKLITAAAMLVLSEIWIGVLFVISGHIVGLANPPLGRIVLWCALGTLGGMVMVSIQILLSMFVHSFALPVGISFAGGLSGLYFLAKRLGHIWPYSLMAYGMNANATTQQLTQSGYMSFAVVCIVYIAIFTVIGSIVAIRQDI